jgi:hypothetical protein
MKSINFSASFSISKNLPLVAIGYPKYVYHRLPTRKEAAVSWRE